MNRTVLITGATSGFGKAAALLFAKNQDRVIITGRRENRLKKLKDHIQDNYGTDVHTLCFDVRYEEEVHEAIDSLKDDWWNIDILINNAGLASGLDLIDEGQSEDWDKMIDTNVKGLLYVSKAVIPIMVGRKKGHIINIGSTAGKEVYPRGNVYCASKHAVDAITKGMRMDLIPHGIKVTQIAPGAADTEFSTVRFHGDKVKADSVYKGYEPMVAEDIANLILYTCSLPDHLCINDLVVTSLAQANSYVFHKTDEEE